VAIVGAGAAGLATAIFAAGRLPGRRIVLLDGAVRLGAKILVSGGSRCNVTNVDVSASDYWGGNARVIEAVLKAFPSPAAVEWFASLGVPLHEEEDGKLFPDTNRSRTVLEALITECQRQGVVTEHPRRVNAIELAPGGFRLETTRGELSAGAVVLATGGLSLPKSGSNGDGLRFAQTLGHSIVPTTPALVPLTLDGTFHQPLSGVSHPAVLTVASDGRRPVRLQGSLLWTHFGISGPVALNASRHWLRARLEGGRCRLLLSMLPGLDFDAADRLLRVHSQDAGTTAVRSTLARALPASLVARLLETVGIDAQQTLSQLARDDRRRLAHALVEWELAASGTRGYAHAEVTAGGVSLDEVDRTTLASRRAEGLFLVGEVLDVDGRLGGFNFQWAWASAWVAARGLAARLDEWAGSSRDRAPGGHA
jgi:predicted Rossmann fold flavoprotein